MCVVCARTRVFAYTSNKTVQKKMRQTYKISFVNGMIIFITNVLAILLPLPHFSPVSPSSSSPVLQWGTADAEMRVLSAKTSELSTVLTPSVGRNVCLHALPVLLRPEIYRQFLLLLWSERMPACFDYCMKLFLAIPYLPYSFVVIFSNCSLVIKYVRCG